MGVEGRAVVVAQVVAVLDQGALARNDPEGVTVRNVVRSGLDESLITLTAIIYVWRTQARFADLSFL
jgi:hypothetical protein